MTDSFERPRPEPPEEEELLLEAASFASGDEPAPKAPIIRVKASASSVRCPFCHADVLPDEPQWLACRTCFARHHTACWRECRRCATCGSEAALRPRQRIATASGTRAGSYLVNREREVERAREDVASIDLYRGVGGVLVLFACLLTAVLAGSGASWATAAIVSLWGITWVGLVGLTIAGARRR